MYRNAICLLACIAVFTACEREAEVEETAIVTDTATTTMTDTAITTPAEVRAHGWGGINDWDVDANKQVSREEFDRRFGTVYTGWAGTDNTLAADEAADTWRDWFDGNDDNIIDTEEWNRGIANWNLRDYNWGTVDRWDADRDNRITEAEWDAAFPNVRANATWSRDELADTWWDWWDGNDDNIIDASEWETRYGYWGRDNV